MPGLITSGRSTPKGPPVLPLPNLFSRTEKRSLEELISQLVRPGHTTKMTSMEMAAPTPAKIIRNLSSSFNRAAPPGVLRDWRKFCIQRPANAIAAIDNAI